MVLSCFDLKRLSTVTIVSAIYVCIQEGNRVLVNQQIHRRSRVDKTIVCVVQSLVALDMTSYNVQLETPV